MGRARAGRVAIARDGCVVKRRRAVLAFLAVGLAAIGVPASRFLHVTKLTVRGRVVGRDFAPVPGARVALVRAEGPAGPSSVLALVTADEHGRFSAVAEASSRTGTVLSVRALRESGEGFETALLDETKRSAVGTLEAGDVKLDEARGFLLRVRVTADGRPFPGALVALARRRALSEAEVWRTNAEGLLELPVAASTQVVLLREEGHVAEAVTLPREPERLAAATLVAIPCVPLVGVVKDDGGVVPLGSATVLLSLASNPDQVIDRATSDSSGRFAFARALPGKRYRIELEPGTLAADRSERVAIPIELDHPREDARLEASKPGFVHLSSRHDRSSAVFERRVSDSEYRAEYMFEEVDRVLLPPGRWRVIWQPELGDLRTASFTLAPAQELRLDGDPRREVSMRIVSADREPVPAVSVTVVRGRFRFGAWVYSVGNGVVRFLHAPHCEFSVALRAAGWRERIVRVEAGTDTLEVGDVVLEKDAP